MNHPFNRSYQKFADYIRTEFGRLEFSAQMHSYDWNDRHNGYANTQISAGATRPNPNLPIWDQSNNGQDLISWSDEIIFLLTHSVFMKKWIEMTTMQFSTNIIMTYIIITTLQLLSIPMLTFGDIPIIDRCSTPYQELLIMM